MASILYKRLIIDKIIPFLPTNDIIVLHGARQVGKTHILYYLQNLFKNQQQPTYYIDLEDSRLVRILDAGVAEFITHLKEEGVYPAQQRLIVLIDEIQYLKDPSNFLKLIADHQPALKLIVSGSSSFAIKQKFSDSLVGRTVNFDIYNLSFLEFLQFKDYPFSPQSHYTDKKIQELIALYQEYVLAGGYPKIVLATDWSVKEKYLQQIIDTYIKKDIRDLAEIKETTKFNHLLEVLASQSGQLLNVTELANTLKLTALTVERYLFLLEQTYIIRLIRPYSHNIRSELSKTPKIFFYDTGLMHILWLKNLPKTILGQAFETSIFAELIKAYSAEAINYWRTTDKKEIDFILKLAHDTIVPIEVKLNCTHTHRAALRYFAQHYKTTQFKIVSLLGQRPAQHCYYPWELLQ